MFSLQTDYFHLFLCVAIIVLYGEDVTEQQLATDQMLLHFSNLSMHMNGELVLRKVTYSFFLPSVMSQHQSAFNYLFCTSVDRKYTSTHT